MLGKRNPYVLKTRNQYISELKLKLRKLVWFLQKAKNRTST